MQNLYLHLLRNMTKRGYRIRGIARICEFIRKHYSRHPNEIWIKDFDKNLMMQVDLSEHIGSNVFWRGFYSESQLIILDQILKRDDVFFDIGANIGEFTLFAAKRVTEGQVYAFEPTTSMFRKLCINIEYNHFNHAFPQNIALSNECGEAEIYFPSYHPEKHDGLPSLYVKDNGKVTEKVLLMSLDYFFQERHLKKVNCIKIDVEGSELPVLIGGRQTIEKFHPAIIIEVNKKTSNAAGYEPQDILNYLGTLGYSFQIISERGVLLRCDPYNLSDFQNILCVNQGD